MERAGPEPREGDGRFDRPGRVVNASPRWAAELRAPQRRAAENRPRFERTDRVTSEWLLELMRAHR